MVNQQTAEAIAVSTHLPLYVRMHWLAVARVDHVDHALFMPAEVAGLLDASASQISKAITSLVDRLLLCEGSIPTCLRLPMDYWQKRASNRPSVEWSCPRPPGRLRHDGWLLPGGLAVRSTPLAKNTERSGHPLARRHSGQCPATTRMGVPELRLRCDWRSSSFPAGGKT
jgi:hypothetical protein